MKLSQFGVRWPVTTSMIFIAIVVLGTFAYTRVGIDLLPDMDIPVISVITSYSGAGPEEIETSITEFIEEIVSTVQNVDEVNSISLEGISLVTVKFNWDTDLAEAANDIRDSLDLVARRLPEAADSPNIFKFDMSMLPVMVMGVTADESWERLERIVERRVLDPIKRLPGVATAIIHGGGITRSARVKLDRERLRATGITGRQIVNALHAQNLNHPGGRIKSGDTDFLIRIPHEFKRIDEIGEVIVSREQGIVRIKDIAQVEDGFLEKENDFLINGLPAMGIVVQKQSGENTVAVSRAINRAMPSILEGLPSDIQIHQFFDSADFIQNTVSNLQTALMIGGIAVFFMILFFLRDIRASIIVCISVPTSLIITFLLMYVNDYTINQISLSSLAIAIGMVVDNSIVVLDNIKRYHERKVNPRDSAIQGTSEMATAVTASTMTTVAIFLPIIFTTGITRILFGQLATIVSMALIASLVSAMLLAPMLCSKFLKTEHSSKGIFFKLSESFFSKLENFYVSVLNLTLRNRFKTLGVIGLTFVSSLAIIPLVGVEYMPAQDQGFIIMEVELPAGTRFEKTGKACIEVMNIFEKHVPEMRAGVVVYGMSEDYIAFNPDQGSNMGRVEIVLYPKDQRAASDRDIISRVRPMLDDLPGYNVRFSTTDPIGEMIMGGSDDFALDILGYDLQEGIRIAQETAQALEQIEYLQDIVISQKIAKPELRVDIDRERAAAFGLTISQIANDVELYFAGNRTARFREDGHEYDIEVRLREEDRMSIEDVLLVNLRTYTGDFIRLGNVAELTTDHGPTKIERSEQQRYIRISGQVYGTDPGTVVSMAAEIMQDVQMPAGFSWQFAGSEQERVESFWLLLQAALLGMMLVYMVMASQFESLLSPFIIFFSVPFGFMGAILLLAASGNRISVVSILGLIILVGIVVNNGIVLISNINILIRRGQMLCSALINSGRTRLRPVLCTSLTTSIGMMPMALSRGDGSEVWVPIGLSVIGGLLVSTIMTLVLMPVLYSLFARWLVPAEQINQLK